MEHYGPPTASIQHGMGHLYHQYQQHWPQRHEDNGQPSASQDAGRVAMPLAGQYKRCHCKKNKCLKLYCICFAAGVYCNGCACMDCINQPEHHDAVMAERQRILQRSPKAFAPKVVDAVHPGVQLHKKGCRCRKSKCLKKYCECYDAGVACSGICRCENCQNKTAPAVQMQPRMHVVEPPAAGVVRRTRSRGEPNEAELGGSSAARAVDQPHAEEPPMVLLQAQHEQQLMSGYQQQQQQGLSGNVSLEASEQLHPLYQQQTALPPQQQQQRQQEEAPASQQQQEEEDPSSLLDLSSVDIQQLIENPEVAKHIATELGMAEEIQVAAQNAASILKSIMALSKQNMQQLAAAAPAASAGSSRHNSRQPSPVPGEQQQQQQQQEALARGSSSGPAPGINININSSALNSSGIILAPSATSRLQAGSGAHAAAAQVVEARALPALPAGISQQADSSADCNTSGGADSGAGQAVLGEGSTATGSTAAVGAAAAAPLVARPLGLAAAAAAGEPGTVEVWIEPVHPGGSTRGAAGGGGVVRLLHGSYRIGGGAMQLCSQAITTQALPTSAGTLQACPIPVSSLPHALATFPPSACLDTPGPLPVPKLEPGMHEATPLPELPGVLIGQPLSGPFTFPSLGMGSEQQHTPFLFSAQRAYHASAWPGISPLSNSLPVAWDGLGVGASLPGLTPASAAAAHNLQQQVQQQGQCAALAEDALHASLLADPNTQLDSPDVLPAHKRQRAKDGSAVPPQQQQQQQQQRHTAAAALAQQDMLAGWAGHSDLGASGTQDQTRKLDGGRALRAQGGKGTLGHSAAAGGGRGWLDVADKSDSMESQKEMDALQGLCDLKGM